MPKALLAACLLLALFTAAPLHAQSADFVVGFTWEGTESCFDPESPPFTLQGVPAGTARLVFEMKDLDSPNFPHGGGIVEFKGQSAVPRGAFSYKGPCPPAGQHSYQWTVRAEDAKGTVLAISQVMRKFPPR